RQELDLCHGCRSEAPEYDRRRPKLPYIRDFTAVWYYEDRVRGSILRYKFSGARSYAESYGRLMAMRIRQDLPEDVDLVTWVPIGPGR
ncbi:ComF family protein, partial [Klebsiella pneumoniae]|uniref:ComF family protein n=1 Tax=Klebsiella pneumoniae TaxID=573 RepID=UPI0025A1E06E